MGSLRFARSLGFGVAVLLAAGCGNQPARVLLPDPLSDRVAGPAGTAHVSRLGDSLGPTLCFFNSFFDYCYPGPGYCPCPETEVVVPVRAGASVTMSWSAQATPGRSIQRHRWALDIADVSDETPRVNEITDLQHWSAWSATASTVVLRPWSDGEQHRLYVDVGDDMGWRSLGIVRFVAQAGLNQSPDCAGVRAEWSRTWPPDHRLVPVTIAGVTDPDGDPVTITVTDVTQDEPLDGVGDGDTCPDAVLAGGAARIRVERSGAGNGRVYTLAFTATDGHGGACSGSVDVCIPHDRGHGRDCIKDALVTSSLGPCSDGGCPPRRPRRR